MTRRELFEVLDAAVGQVPRVDLAEAAWSRGDRMRRRRRAAVAGGGALLAAAAAAGVFALTGGIGSDGDVAPAVPTHTPGPSQVEPGPVADLSQAHTFVFEREGTTLATGETTLGMSLDEQPVPTDEELAGTSWVLVSNPDLAAGGQETGSLTIGDAADVGVEVPTTLGFSDRTGDTLLWMRTGCTGPAFQEDLDLDATGRFAGQPALIHAIGCDGPDSTGFWSVALESGGWLHRPSEDVLLLSVVLPEEAPTDDETAEATESPTSEPVPAADDPALGAFSLGGGFGIAVEEGWTGVALSRGQDVVDTTCLLPEPETELFYPYEACAAGVSVRTGIDPAASTLYERGWWDPANPAPEYPPETCSAARPHYGEEIQADFAQDPETGSTTVGGHPVEWLRWSASCADGEEFTAQAWRVTDLGIELRSTDGSQDVERVLQSLVLDADLATDSQVVVEVTGPVGDTLSGEVQEWSGAYTGTGEQVTYQVTAQTTCLVTAPQGTLGADLVLGDCADLEQDLAQHPLASLIVSPDGEVVSVRVAPQF